MNIKNNIKKIFASALVTVSILSMTIAGAQTMRIASVSKCADCADSYGIVQVYDANKLTTENLSSRSKDGKIIIERIVGRVKNNKKDGKIIGGDKYYNYISYKGVDCHKGDIILTYCIYNPDSNYLDDVIERFDYVIECNHNK